MPKIISEDERESYKIQLFDKGLQLIMEKGLKNVTIDNLVALAPISKGYFYVLFESKESFVLDAICWQMEGVFETLKLAKDKGCTNEEILIIHKSIFKRMRFANYLDVIQLSQKITPKRWAKFQNFQIEFFTNLLNLLGGDPERCDPKVISNLSAVFYLSYTIHKQGMYVFKDKADDVSDILLDALYRYIQGN